MQITDALYNLLYDENFRQKFINNDLNALNLTPDDQLALLTIDKKELQDTANIIVRNLLHNIGGYGGELYISFQDFFTVFKKFSPEALVKQFLKSEFFKMYHIIPYNGHGLCLQEAFYLFMCEQKDSFKLSENDNYLLRHQFLSALIKILAINQNPSFRLEARLIKSPHLKIVYTTQEYSLDFVRTLGIQDNKTTMLYAATQTKIIIGPISDCIKKILNIYHHHKDKNKSLSLMNFEEKKALENLKSFGLA